MSTTQWGLAKCGFSTITRTSGDISAFATPHVQVGAISANITFPDSDNNKLAADNGVIFDGSGSQVQVELTVSKFDAWFKKNVLGYFEDGGGLGIGRGSGNEVAFLAENNTDEGGARWLVYCCTSSKISVNYNTNAVNGDYSFATESVTLTGRLVKLPNDTERVYFEVEEGDTGYADFWTSVYYPVEEQNGGATG